MNGNTYDMLCFCMAEGGKCLLQAERYRDENEGCYSYSEHHLPSEFTADVPRRYKREPLYTVILRAMLKYS